VREVQLRQLVHEHEAARLRDVLRSPESDTAIGDKYSHGEAGGVSEQIPGLAPCSRMHAGTNRSPDHFPRKIWIT
jgi:hypothetical protein